MSFAIFDDYSEIPEIAFDFQKANQEPRTEKESRDQGTHAGEGCYLRLKRLQEKATNIWAKQHHSLSGQKARPRAH